VVVKRKRSGGLLSKLVLLGGVGAALFFANRKAAT